MNKDEIRYMLENEIWWLIALFTSGELSQDELEFLWFPSCDHTRQLAASQRRNPKTIKELVEKNPRTLLLSMVRVQLWHRKGINNPRREYWNRKTPKPSEVREDPHQFNPESDLMVEVYGYAMACCRADLKL